MPKPLILVTNDDGIQSPGLHAAIAALNGLGNLLVIAPSEQQSAMSRSLSPMFDGSIKAIEFNHNGYELEAYHLKGSPAQSVLYGVVEIADRRPDLVVSGINYGENLGSNTMISGTVGAALQGGDMGIPAIAISLETKKDYHYNHGHDVDWRAATHWLRQFSRKMLANTIPEDVKAIKIDLPSTATEDTAWRLTTQSSQSYYIPVPTNRLQPDDALTLGYDIFVDHDKLEPESDIYAFSVDRIISVTPLSVNLSARISLRNFEATLRASHDARDRL